MSSFHRIRIINLLVLIVLVLGTVAWQPQKTYAACGGGGSSYWTDGGRASSTTSYSYKVTGAPPNMPGRYHLYRNNVYETSSWGWISTDGNGNATKGPWTPTANETATEIYIEWQNGSCTNKTFHINDVTAPFIRSTQGGGYGVPIPTAYSGTASDAKWGTGFDFGPFGWTSASATYQNISTGKYYGSGGYTYSSPVYYYGANLSPCCGGFNLTWSATPPPPSAHNSNDNYRWCVTINDFFYTSPADCITFTGPR